MKKIGRIRAQLAMFAALLAPSMAGADQFTAVVDRAEVGMDESVSLRMTIVLNTASFADTSPRFVAPDFDELNEYQEANQEMRLINGQLSMRTIIRHTKVLRPTKTGNLKISNIHVNANGNLMRAPDLTVKVSAAGAGTPPPRGYGGGGVGLRGAAKPTRGKNVMVRAEVDKSRAYKGEQLIVSYYLYHRVPILHFQAEKFPVLNGFLREELEMPIQGPRLESDIVVHDGSEYRRSLLVRYAAYPLQEGRLKIDQLAVAFDYVTVNSVDEEDIASLLFGRGTRRKGNERSEIFEIEVKPLPQGKPGTFTGAVGDFAVSSAVDRYELKANEALNLTVKIEGKGNAASIGEPKVKWPDGLEIYDSKGRAKSGKGGVGEKVYEYALIPRTPGRLQVPAIEFSYFDPSQEKYVTKTTEPIELNVLEGAPGSAPPPKLSTEPNPALESRPQSQDVPRALRPPLADEAAPSLPLWRYLYWVFSTLLVAFVAFVAWDQIQRLRGRIRPAKVSKGKKWEELRSRARLATQGAPWAEVVQTYDELSNEVFDSLDQRYGLGARSLSRKSLGEALTEDHGLAREDWMKFNSLLEFAEIVKYASSTGVVTEASARQELSRWVDEGERMTRSLQKG